MKKAVSILMATMMMTLSACGSQTVAGSNGSSQPAASTAKSSESQMEESVTDESDTGLSDETADANTESQESTESAEATGDTLIIYFSANNLNDTDAVSSATPVIDGASSVGWIADIIQETTGAEIRKITPVDDYALDFDSVADYAKQERDVNGRPAFQPLDVNPTAYKTVFIGYPVWWYTVPMIMETFLDTYDFTGVTLVPFNTHEGSGNGGTYNTIREREPGATVLDGFALRGGDAGNASAREDVIEWLNNLNLE